MAQVDAPYDASGTLLKDSIVFFGGKVDGDFVDPTKVSIFVCYSRQFDLLNIHFD